MKNNAIFIKSTKNICDYYNIAVVGKSKVGKTSLIETYCYNLFRKTKKEGTNRITISKNIIYNKVKYKIKFWDLDISEGIDDDTNIILNKCDGIIFISSFDDKNSLDNINIYFQSILKNIDLSDKELMLIINKCDLIDKKINDEEIDKKTKDLQLVSFEVSSKTKKNIKNAIKNIFIRIYERKKILNDGEEQKSMSILLNKKNNQENDNCIR